MSPPPSTPDRADRQADQQPAQRDPARPRVPEARSLLARPALPGEEDRDRHGAEAAAAERHQEGPADRPGEGDRVRPERAVQEGLRGGVRHLRRPSLRLLVGDYEFGRHPQDIACWRSSRTWPRRRTRRSSPRPSPKLFDLESFTELAVPRDLAKIFETSELIKWQSFRESEDSRYVGLDAAARPDAPALRPGHDPGRRRSTSRRTSTASDHSKYLWGNAAYALAPAAHRRLRAVRLVRGNPRRRGRRPGRGAAGPHLQDRRRRRRPEVPDRDRHHRPAREGAVRPRLHRLCPLQGHRLRGVLRRPVGQEAEEVQHRPRPTPTRASRRSCRTSWRSRASPTTSRR